MCVPEQCRTIGIDESVPVLETPAKGKRSVIDALKGQFITSWLVSQQSLAAFCVKWRLYNTALKGFPPTGYSVPHLHYQQSQYYIFNTQTTCIYAVCVYLRYCRSPHTASINAHKIGALSQIPQFRAYLSQNSFFFTHKQMVYKRSCSNIYIMVAILP